MIVDAHTLDVRPIADELLRDAAGTAEYVGEFEADDVCWSNELVSHVVELKTAQPAPALPPLVGQFGAHVRRINELLEARGARLMPGGMHPWMDPLRETKLWAHDYNEVYACFDRIFGCQGHGWSNLQSAHLNLPFADDEEFGRLHAAIRLVLPLLPALAASSPVVERRATGLVDSRLDVYRTNSRKIPSIAGQVVPEAAFTAADYQRTILEPIYADIAPHDPQGVLRHEWLNARGAIARFERSAIEIRVLDTQECPASDLAICALTAATIAALVEEHKVDWARQQAFATERLHAILLRTIADGERAVIDDSEYLALFGQRGSQCLASELWHTIHSTVAARLPVCQRMGEALAVILEQGPLARRVSRGLGCAEPSSATASALLDSVRLREVYARLCDCLARGQMFVAD